jgi:hypothetical protein
MSVNSAAIHVHIESLVVRGLGRISESALSAALHQALRRELRSMPALSHAVLPRADTAVTLAAGCSAEQLGGALARALGGIIRGGGTAGPAPDRFNRDNRHG